jgi:hypothetical protein
LSVPTTKQVKPFPPSHKKKTGYKPGFIDLQPKNSRTTCFSMPGNATNPASQAPPRLSTALPAKCAQMIFLRRHPLFFEKHP